MASERTDQDGDPTYAFKASLIGAAARFTLGPDAIAWEIGRRSGRIRYDRVKAVRLSYRPVTMQSHRFIAEIWSPDSPKIQLVSVSCRSLMEQERLDRAYSAFVAELHRRLVAAGAATQFSTGVPAVIYWLGATACAAVAVAIVVVGARTALAMQWTAAMLAGAFFAVFAYQAGNYLLRNRPGRYRPDAIPASVLPKP
jgi:hypothetical protein